MYYNITFGELSIKEIRNLSNYQLEDHSHKQKEEDSRYFEVYKLISGKNYIWLRINKNTETIKSFHRPKNVNEYQFIIDFMELNPDLRITDESGEPMHFDTVKMLLPLREKILNQFNH